MDMVMDVLASNDWGNRVRLFLLDATRALELSRFLLETGLNSLGVAVLKVTLFGSHHLVSVLLWQDFAVLHRLNGSVVVVLVNLTVDDGLSLFMTLLNDVLVDHGWGDFLVDSGIMLTGLGPVVQKC